MEVVTILNGSAKLAAEVTGKGSLAIFLHAGVADRRMWRTSCEVLSHHFQCVVFDRRGFGETTTRDEPFQNVDDLDAVMRHFGYSGAHLIGSSQGGRIAIDYALAHPDNVKSLVLAAPALTGAAIPEKYPPVIQRLMNELEQAEAALDFDKMNTIEAHMWLDGPLSDEFRVLGPARDLFLEMNGKILRHFPLTQEQLSPIAIDQLHRLTHPTLVIWGDADFQHIQERSRFIAETLHARHLQMPACAHLPNLEQPAKFNDIVLEFLAGQE